MALAVPHSLLTLVQAVDPVHAGEVAWLARAASDAAGVDGDLAFAAGLVHDVGKLWVPPEVLHAERPLREHEWGLVRAHPVDGEGLVRRGWPDVPEAVLHAVRHHHEREDGSGYPDGLRTLPLLTALVAAADVYAALRRDRCYRAAVGEDRARAVVRGLALPERVVEAVLSAARQGVLT